MKANNNDHNQIMALDIGSSKVSCVIARSQINKKIFIEGISSISYRPSNENKSSDNQEMIEAIKESFFSANTGSSTKIQSVIVGLSGTFINSTNVNLNIPRSGNVKLVTQSDIDNAVKIAKHIDLEEGKELIHVIPQSFSLDGMQGIRNPLGMHTTELKASCHIIAGSKNNICNLNKSILEADIQPTNQVVGSVATARALLTAKEREEGAIMIDIGASTTDIAVFNSGSVIHTDSIPMGGNLFTSDIATAFDIDFNEAEKIKINHGSTTPERALTTNTLSIKPLTYDESVEITERELAQLIKERANELVRLIAYKLENEVVTNLEIEQIVLTGGCSKLDGLVQLMRFLLQKRVRCPDNQLVNGLHEENFDPSLSCVISLAMWGEYGVDKNIGHVHHRKFRFFQHGFFYKKINALKIFASLKIKVIVRNYFPTLFKTTKLN